MSFDLVSVEQLQGAFERVEPIAPWGLCVVVKEADWLPRWQQDLASQGVRCHFGFFDGRTAVFVPLKRVVPEGKVVYVPPATFKLAAAEPTQITVTEEVKKTEKTEVKKTPANWIKPSNKIADDYIIELWQNDKTYGEIEKAVEEKYPNENICVEYRIQVLLKKKLIVHRSKRAPRAKSANEAKLTEDKETTVDPAGEKVKHALFEDAWVSQLDGDLKQKSEAFYNAALTAGLPTDAVKAAVACFQEIDALSQNYDDVISTSAAETEVLKHKIALISHPEDKAYATFEEIWKKAKDDEYNNFAENFYDAAVEHKLPSAIIEAMVICLEEIDAERKLNSDAIEKQCVWCNELEVQIKELQMKLTSHGHDAATGKASISLAALAKAKEASL